MAGKILAALLLLFGGGVTLYILYKIALGIIHPVVQKKIATKMMSEKTEQLQNNLKLHEQTDQQKVKATQQSIKK